jgi:acyl-coenzyme A synthetase/AMP-(fatty) acid ligase
MGLIQEFSQRAANRLEQIAIISERSQMSYGDVLGTVRCFEQALISRGVKDGQTIVLLGKRIEFTIAMTLLASLRAYRVIFAPVAAVERAGIAFDWVLGTEAIDLISADRQILIGPDWFSGMRDAGIPDYSNATSERDGALVFTTSGSSGEPKFVETSVQARMDNAMRDGPGFVKLDMKGRRFCTTVAAGASWAMLGHLSALLSGGSVLSLSEGTGSLLGYIDLYRMDALVTTPVVLSQILNTPNAEQFLTSLMDVRVGGALASNELVHRFAERFDLRVHIGYGSTEFGFTLGHVYDPLNPASEGYLGEPANDDIEIAFYDDNFEKLPDYAKEGVVGFRRTKQKTQRKYIASDQSDRSAGFREGVFFPGDILRRSNAGYQFIGRTKNIVNVSGNKYSIDRVVAFLAARYPTVQMAPLVDVDVEGIERIMVVVAGGVAPDREDIEQKVQDAFVGLCVSRVETVDALPLTPTHKIDFVALRAAFMAPKTETPDA